MILCSYDSGCTCGSEELNIACNYLAGGWRGFADAMFKDLLVRSAPAEGEHL